MFSKLEMNQNMKLTIKNLPFFNSNYCAKTKVRQVNLLKEDLLLQNLQYLGRNITLTFTIDYIFFNKITNKFNFHQ